MTLLGIILIVVLFIIIVWPVINVTLVSVIIKRSNVKPDNKWVTYVISFLKSSAERKMFYAYLSTIGTLGGVLPFSAKLYISFQNQNELSKFWLTIDDVGLDNVSLGLAIIITIGYALQLLYNIKKNGVPQYVIDAAGIINNELSFKPNQRWFEEVTKKGITQLYPRYREDINYSYSFMDYAMLALTEDDDITVRFSKKMSDLHRNAISFIKGQASEINGKDELDAIKNDILVLLSTFRTGWPDKSLFEKAKMICSNLPSSISGWYYKYIFKTGKESKSHYNQLMDSVNAIANALTNPWLSLAYSKTTFVTGIGGIGKSHVIGEMANRMTKKSKPAVLCLGESFGLASDPIHQLLSILDVKVKKETFLSELDLYGKTKNQKVVIFIDGINEGYGEMLWKGNLVTFVSEIEKYEHIKLVISIRTSTQSNWFNSFLKRNNIFSIEHKGFSENVYAACEYMFDAYRLNQPVWPVYGKEFSNPLWLSLYCRVHELKKNNVVIENKWTVIQSYLYAFENELSNQLGYEEANRYVEKSIIAFSDELSESTDQLYSLSYDKAKQAIYKATNKEDFIDVLINCSILRKIKDYTGGFCVTMNYETIGDYYLAYSFVNRKDASQWFDKSFLEEQFAVIVPQVTGKEWFEFSQNKEELGLSYQSFIDSLQLRDKLTDAGNKVLQDILTQKKWDLVWQIISKCPYYDFPINAGILYRCLYPLSMAERDALWTTAISSQGDTNESIHALADWAMGVSRRSVSKVESKYIILLCELFIWSLSSTDISLRDKCTKALVVLLSFNTDILLSLLGKYTDINDPYIKERLYAVSFGCCTKNRRREDVAKVAQFTYNHVFDKRPVVNNILVRDYATLIIDFAKFLKCNIIVDNHKLSAPFNTPQKPTLPSIDYIKKHYVLEWDKTTDKEFYRAQMAILDSMVVEHSKRGIYGDFGRYVFDSALDYFPIDTELYSNWVVDTIFTKYGYDANVFKKFDNKVSSADRHRNTVERIGKKYQWIALYEVSALLSDLFYGKENKDTWRSDATLYLRNIDPTINSINGYKTSFLHGFEYNTPLYDLYDVKDNIAWMKAYKKMPSVNNYLFVNGSGTDWINLFSYNTITSQEKYDLDISHVQRELWTFVQSYCVDNAVAKKICRIIQKEGIAGRDADENGDVFRIRYGELYWSKYSKSEIIDAGYFSRKFSIRSKTFDKCIIHPTYFNYLLEDCSDRSEKQSIHLLVPSSELIDALNLHPADREGIWLNNKDEVICFDSFALNGGKAALLIKKDVFLDYLSSSNQSVVWPILMERTLVLGSGNYYPRIQVGGYAIMNSKGKIRYSFRSYDDDPKLLKNRVGSIVNKNKNKVRKFLVKNRIIKVPMWEYLQLMSEEE